jgi:rSAM/selenodomain-associated transferase 1
MAKKRRKNLLNIQNYNNLKSENLLLIFTRNPELGKVKSRLAKDVGDEAALNIYNFLLEHTVSVTKNLEVSKEVYYSEEIWEHDMWDKTNYSKQLQEGEDLGARMFQAFKNGFKNGFKNIIIIGSDLYDLHTKDLEAAFRLLQNKEAVIGPATDGGYYLLGMNKLYPEVFQHKNWGTPSVLEDTLKDLKRKDLSVLEPRNDVDYFSDIEHHPDFQRFFKQQPTSTQAKGD